MKQTTQLSYTAVLGSIALIQTLGMVQTTNSDSRTTVDCHDIHANIIDAMCWLKRLAMRPASITPSPKEILDEIQSRVTKILREGEHSGQGYPEWQKMDADPSDYEAWLQEWNEIRTASPMSNCSDITVLLYHTWRFDPSFDTWDCRADIIKFHVRFLHNFLRITND